MAQIKAIRGMNDILPADTATWQYLEDTVLRVLKQYGYQQIRMPIVEHTELFERSIGAVTDIVEKEMYTFDDRNGQSITLRPEGTACCVRACEEHGLLYHQIQRLWYAGPMFRYERPQKGRYRQFNQIGVETFGMSGPDIDAELIFMSARLWRELSLLDHVTLEINSLGNAVARTEYRDALVSYLEKRVDQLDVDSQRRMSSNPLRILDSKNPATQALLEGAPNFKDYLDAESAEHFNQLLSLLDAGGIDYNVNPRLVRGLDYYSKTVFEWVTHELGAQGTICAGGRYDGLVAQLGGKATPAVGFAMGVERLVLMLQTLELVPAILNTTADVYIASVGKNATRTALQLAESLRSELIEWRVLVNCNDGGFKGQLKRADKSGAAYAVLITEEGSVQNVVTVKPLRGGEQISMANSEVLAYFNSLQTQ